MRSRHGIPAGHVVVAATLAAMLLAALSARAADGDDRVLIAAPPSVRADALWMALAGRFFDDERLRVSAKWVASGHTALTALTERDKPGAAHFVAVNEMLAMSAWRSTAGEFTVIAPLARDAESYVAIAKAAIASPAALRTKTIAVTLGTTTAWFLAEYLRAHGLSELDVALRNQSSSAVLDWDPATSDVDAWIVREPYATQALQKHGGAVHRLATAKGYVHAYLFLGTTKRYLREHPGVAERLLRALDRGRERAAAERDAVLGFARGMFGPETAVADVEYAVTARLVGIDAVTVGDVRRLGRFMKDAGVLDQAADPVAVFDTGPLRAVFPERVPRELGAEPR